MATKISKAGPRRIVYAPNAGQINTAMPARPHPSFPLPGPPQRLKPAVGKPGLPDPTPVFPVAGHFTTNEQGNIVRVSASGRVPKRPLTPFQGASTPSGNPTVNYAPRVGVSQDAPTIKVAGTSILAINPLPGNPKRRGAQPVSTVMPYSRKWQHGGQAYLPAYKRKKAVNSYA